MNSFILMVPLIVIRLFLLKFLNKDADKVANKFVPTIGNEKIGSYIYQLSTIILFFLPLFLRLNSVDLFSILGGVFYVFGIVFQLLSILTFSNFSNETPLTSGVYKICRHPMYIGYDLYFIGYSMITHSELMGCITVLFVLSSHFLIVSEERWCKSMFGEDYLDYIDRVKRYGLF